MDFDSVSHSALLFPLLHLKFHPYLLSSRKIKQNLLSHTVLTTIPGAVSAYAKCSDAGVCDLLARFTLPITTLAYCSGLELSETPPAGCAILTISEKCEVHVNFKVSCHLHICTRFRIEVKMLEMD